MNAARCFICQKYVFVKFGRKNNFGIKQVLFAGFFNMIFSDSAQIFRGYEQIRDYVAQLNDV